MNPPSFAGRQELPSCISAYLDHFYIEEYTIAEVIEIFKKKY